MNAVDLLAQLHNTSAQDDAKALADGSPLVDERVVSAWRDRPDVQAWRKARENVTYTDGSRVGEGDSIRYHQAPGGLMPHGDWLYGVAAFPPDSGELCLLADDGRLYNLYGHVIERAS